MMSEPAIRPNDPDRQPPTVLPRSAASVILLREGAHGMVSWMIDRVTMMSFAAGMTVFPGGKVEPTDDALPWAVPPPGALTDRLGGGPEPARALLGCAARETFEETGILLSHPRLRRDLSAYRTDVEWGTRRNACTASPNAGVRTVSIPTWRGCDISVSATKRLPT